MADGYDPNFLTVRVPLPASAPDAHELTYPRFTVLLHPERRMAAVTAVNIDGAQLRELPRSGDWRLDPRVPDGAQTGPEVYTRNDLDRGHLVRRRDPGWGEDAAEAMEATFFYTNAAPQASGFNQSKELWLGLEDHVLEYAETTDQRISVFTAPVFEDDDPPYRGIQIPLRFWKIAAWAVGDRSAAAGFVLDQTELVDIRNGLIAVRPLGAFRTFQVPVAEIGAMVGVDVGPLADADVLAAPAVRGEEWRMLLASSDIVLRRREPPATGKDEG